MGPEQLLEGLTATLDDARKSGDLPKIEIGQIEAIFRYPVKSMRGESLHAATLG